MMAPLFRNVKYISVVPRKIYWAYSLPLITKTASVVTSPRQTQFNGVTLETS